MIKITESNVTIMVKNMDKAVQFYLDIGLTLKQRWDNHYAMVTTEGITIGLHPSEGEQLSSGSLSIGFMIDVIDDATTLLDGLKIPYDKVAGGSGIYVHFRDPDNTILYFVQPKWDKHY